MKKADGGPNQEFRFPFNDHFATTCDLNQALLDLPAAQANVFYWVNTIHDYFYSLGFDEPAGNFQLDNFGKGGEGLDFVWAEVLDGAGTNNASYGTPPDGFAGRMNLYYWTMSCRDPAFDSMLYVTS